MPAATAREHGRKRLLLKSEDEFACFASGNRSRTVLSRGLAERLAVGEIAEIIVYLSRILGSAEHSGQRYPSCQDFWLGV